MENIKHKSEDVAKKEFTPKETACSSGSKEYNTFIDGINLICIEEGIDSSQASGKLLISVLSAVAEIERENIIEQTMNGRKEKARQGGWNGGFAPYGYYLKDKNLFIL